jgi:hypothetical protein
MDCCKTCTHFLPNEVLEEGDKLAKIGHDGLCARPGMFFPTLEVKDTMKCGYFEEPPAWFSDAMLRAQ